MPDAAQSPLRGRRIVLGVTGGIAAYKAVEVCRRLVDEGAHVIPVMTAGARRFVGETTFSALASEPVQSSLWDEDSPIPHTRLGQGADLVVVCPATARLLGTYAAGISNDLLTATLLATRAPVVVCPAMHTEMWEHPAVQQNLATLRGRGVRVVAPAGGPPRRRRPGQGSPGRAGGDRRGGAARADPADAGRPPGRGVRRRHPRADRPGPLHLQPLLRQAGLRRRRGGRRPGWRGHPGHDRRPAGQRRRRAASRSRPRRRCTRRCCGPQRTPTSSSWPPPWPTSARPGWPPARSRRRRGGLDTVVLEQTADILADLGRRKPDGQVLVGFAAETVGLRRQRGRQAGPQAGRPHRRQRRVRPRGRLRARHERRGHPRRATAARSTSP